MVPDGRRHHSVYSSASSTNVVSKRDIYVNPSWRYADPRAGIIEGKEWEALRPIICRSLGLSSASGATLSAIASELDSTYRDVLNRLPENPAVRFAENGDKTELILSPLDAIRRNTITDRIAAAGGRHVATR